ncbi:hypothetical protein CVT30_23970 [Streptomyces sp. AMCC400023]|nr:hypothetical protein CVT30_23970 [Streptomyces sp. AMCC400023]
MSSASDCDGSDGSDGRVGSDRPDDLDGVDAAAPALPFDVQEVSRAADATAAHAVSHPLARDEVMRQSPSTPLRSLPVFSGLLEVFAGGLYMGRTRFWWGSQGALRKVSWSGGRL